MYQVQLPVVYQVVFHHIQYCCSTESALLLHGTVVKKAGVLVLYQSPKGQSQQLHYCHIMIYNASLKLSHISWHRSIMADGDVVVIEDGEMMDEEQLKEYTELVEELGTRAVGS